VIVVSLTYFLNKVNIFFIMDKKNKITYKVSILEFLVFIFSIVGYSLSINI
jgi:hypothetical protein